MIIAVASGKGGTGKTTVAVNLARAFGAEIQLLDCDVEEPNDHVFLNGRMLASEAVAIRVPQVNQVLCDGCGECSRFCEYHAIVSFGAAPLLFPEMCHGCGGCIRVCPQQALSETAHNIGVVETVKSGKITLIQGRLDVGVAMAPPLIRAVKVRLCREQPVILDAPPGTSCPVITAIRETDATVLVTEPTPFGLHDLKLTVGMIRELGVPFGVVVNRVGQGDDRVHAYCREEGIPLMAEIPEDRQIAEVYSRGQLIVDELPEYQDLFQDLIAKLLCCTGAVSR